MLEQWEKLEMADDGTSRTIKWANSCLVMIITLVLRIWSTLWWAPEVQLFNDSAQVPRKTTETTAIKQKQKKNWNDINTVEGISPTIKTQKRGYVGKLCHTFKGTKLSTQNYSQEWKNRGKATPFVLWCPSYLNTDAGAKKH